MKHNIVIVFVALMLAPLHTTLATQNPSALSPHSTPAAPRTSLKVAVLIPTPQMHCQKCENKIKKNMRFEKGVRKVETDLEAQHVSITYDPKKATVESLQAGMKKIGYDTKVVSDKGAEG